jgi:hypothetical protein
MSNKLIGKIYRYIVEKCTTLQPGEKKPLTTPELICTETEFRLLLIDICDCENAVLNEDDEEEEEDDDYEEEEEEEEEIEESEEEASAESTEEIPKKRK